MGCERPNFSIGALSQQTGAHIETTRYYEKIGLLTAAAAHRRRTSALHGRAPEAARLYPPRP